MKKKITWKGEKRGPHEMKCFGRDWEVDKPQVICGKTTEGARIIEKATGNPFFEVEDAPDSAKETAVSVAAPEAPDNAQTKRGAPTPQPKAGSAETEASEGAKAQA